MKVLPAARLFGVLTVVCLSHHTHAQKQEAAPPVPAQIKPNATFVQPPDPSTIAVPPPVSTEPLPNGLPDFPPSLNLLPPGTSGGTEALGFTMRLRGNPSLVPDGPNATEEAASALDRRCRYQTARARALSDPMVEQALSEAKKARTDRELREAMRRHYQLLFTKMRSMDGALEPLISERETAALEPLIEKFPRAQSRSTR